MMESLAQIAYEAYAEAVGHVAVDGQPLPEWTDMEPKLQNAWDRSAQAVARQVGGNE